MLHVVGARPNFPKLAPVHRAAAARNVSQRILHTGQHYDEAMSASFFEGLGIPAPDVSLDVGSGTHAAQTARIMERIEPALLLERPTWVVVYGDVNSTLAAAVVASKLGIRLAHVEAGLRSFDRTMPEEINRIVTDRLADLLLAPSEDAVEQLKAEGEPNEEIVLVGNVMIDTLMEMLPRAKDTGVKRRLSLTRPHALVTLHRPSNVDDADRLAAIMRSLDEIASDYDVVFPVHPRTRARLAATGGRVRCIEPLPYIEMLEVMRDAAVVVTDSGGVQEETTVLGVPCFTLRPNTERPITVTQGTNQVVPDPAALPAAVRAAHGRPRKPSAPKGWDGKASQRVVDALLSHRIK